jgi:hypothetical protein
MPSKKYLHDIDLVQNQLLNAVLDSRSSAPASGVDGQIYYNNASKQFFYYNGTTTLWQAIAGAGLTNPMTALGDIIYGGASGAVTRLAGNITTTRQFLSQTGTGSASAAPTWATITGSDITGAALTSSNDTNVTLTLGGTPATSLLRAASLTLGWTGTLAVSRGGTGLGSLGSANQLIRVNAGGTALEYFTSTFLTANQTITLTGVVTGSGATSITTAIANGAITNAMLANGAVANLSGTNSGDNAVNSLYSGLVSNATHTGDATGATTLTVVALRGVTLPTLGASAGFLRYTGTGTNTWVFDTSVYITANQTITLSGNVTGSGTTSITTTIANNVVTNAMLAQIATARIKGRVTAATGNVEDLTGTQVTTLLDSFAGSIKGLVPVSVGGTTNFLRADGVWAVPAGGGGGTPGGSNTQVQYNNSGAFAGSANFTWNNTNSILTVASSNGVVQQLNGLATSNAYIDFQNAGTTQWRVGNDYNGGSRLFRINDVAGSVNTMLVNSSNQIGFNMPTTSFLASNSAMEFHKAGTQYIHRHFSYSNSGGGVQWVGYSTKSNTAGSFAATTNSDVIVGFTAMGSSNSAYVFGGDFYYRQGGATSTYVPGAWEFFASSGSVANQTRLYVDGANDNVQFWTTSTERMRVASSGAVLISTTTDNGVDKLQVNGSAIASTLKVNTSGQTVSISSYYNGGTGKNIWIGGGGLSSTSVSESNVSVGVDALLNNTSGYYNTAIGFNALKVNTTGYVNDAFGYGALAANTSGYRNVSFGASSLGANTSGYENMAIGHLTLVSNTTGFRNVSIGAISMFENTTGYSNIAFGYDAGRRISGGGANQTSNTSIYIGEDTRSSANGNTNEMVFGHNAVGQGSNTVTLGNSSITQTLLRGTVTGGSFVRSGGTSSQVLYADGGVKQITSGTAAPSGGNDGDIYLQYV